MYVPGLTRCSAALHLYVQYPEGMTIGALGIVVTTCAFMYPYDTPQLCEFGGVKEEVQASYSDGTVRTEDWCVVLDTNDLDEARIERMKQFYPDFLIRRVE